MKTTSETDEKTQSLYDIVVDATNIEFDESEFETLDKYKAHICRHLFDMEETEFDKLPAPLRTWYNDAAKVVKANRGAKNKQHLPMMEGLPGDEAAADEDEKKLARRRGAASDKGEADKGGNKRSTAKKTTNGEGTGKRGRSSDLKNNRYGKIARAMLDLSPTLEITDEAALKAALKTGVSESTAGYGIPATRAIADALKDAGWRPPR